MHLHIPFTELTSLTLLLLMLYWLRRSIGIIPVYLLIGLFFIFGQVTLLPAFTENFLETEQLNFLTYGLLLLPVIMMYLVIYETEDTMEAQRFIFGMVVMVVAFIYIIQLITGQYHSETVFQMPKIIQVLATPNQFYFPLILLTATHALLMLILPISYQAIRNLHVPVIISMFLHITIFDLVSLLLQHFLARETDLALQFTPRIIISWLLAVLLVSLLAHLYIRFNTRTPVSLRHRSPVGILTTLLNHVFTAGQIRQSVEEWAGRYQVVFDHTVEMIFLVDENGAVINANHSAVSAFGPVLYDSGYIIADKLTDDKRQPFPWKENWNNIQHKTEKITISFTNMMLIAGNQEKNVDFNISPVTIYDLPMAIIIMRDTTLERQKERERKQLEETLMHSQRLEALGTLAGGIAHDFNNLIFGIQTSAEIIRKEPLPHHAVSMLNNIDNATARAASLTSKLLGFARKGKYQEQLLDATSIARAAADLFRIGLKNVDFKCLIEPGTFIILGDETQLQQVLLNILLNAKDALKNEDDAIRKITLRIDRATPEMHAWQQRPQETAANNSPDAYVAIRIKDTGTGMDAETMEHIFDPFYTTKERKGTGLGMAMAYGCVTHHRGWLSINSAIGKGTEVSIMLPLMQDNQQPHDITDNS